MSLLFGTGGRHVMQKWLLFLFLVSAGCSREERNIELTKEEMVGRWQLVEYPSSLKRALGKQDSSIDLAASGEMRYWGFPIKTIRKASWEKPSFWSIESGQGSWVLSNGGSKHQREWNLLFSASKEGFTFKVSRRSNGRLSIWYWADVERNEKIRFEKQ